MDTIQGKHFRIIETDKALLKEFPKYAVEKLQYSEELRGDLKKKTFFIDEPALEEDLVILSFGQNRVVVNMGVLEENKVKISKKPVPIKFDTIYSEEETVYKEFKYTPDLKRPISIIDPETTEEVKPILYFDKETNEVKGKCKLRPYKPYFAFEIRDKKEDV